MHGLSSSQSSPEPRETHFPARQSSSPSQTSLLSQVEPSASGVFTQPWPETQLPLTQGTVGMHSGVMPSETQVPDWQVSKPLQGSPSGQDVPSDDGVQSPAVLSPAQVMQGASQALSQQIASTHRPE